MRAQEVEGVGALEAHAVLHAVEARVFQRAGAGVLADVHARDLRRAVARRVQGKAARVREAVQHPHARHKRRDGGAVFLLVEEKARLLALLDIHQKAHAVFLHLHAIRHLAKEQARLLAQALQLAHGHVVSLVHAARRKLLHQRVHDIALEPLHAKAENLQHDHVAELVRDHSGQAVALGEDQAAAVQVRKAAAVVQRAMDPPADERRVDGLVPPGEDAQADLRARIVHRHGQKPARRGEHPDGQAVRRAVLALDIASEYPGMPAEHALLAAPAQVNIHAKKPPHETDMGAPLPL